MFIDNFEPHLTDLHDGKINHREFLANVDCDNQFKNWCADHGVEPDETNASLFFDMHGFEESTMQKEFIVEAAS